MKKIMCILITITLLFTVTDVAFAKKKGPDKNNHKKYYQEYKKGSVNYWYYKGSKEAERDRKKEVKQEFKIDGAPVINYKNFKLPINPVVKGMQANIAYDKSSAELKIERGDIVLIINFKNETVTLNGVTDTKSGIFKAKNSKKKHVLIKYIAEILGARVKVDDDEIEVTYPDLERPYQITVTPVGNTVVNNTLNTTTLYMTAAAKIKAGQATGGRAELYVGTKLVATDNNITATDTEVNFTTSDGTPTNEELQAAVPNGGPVTVKLYNANNKAVSGSGTRLTVDYKVPVIANVLSAVYEIETGLLKLTVSGAGDIGDQIDVLKLSFIDQTTGRAYQLTNGSGSGSKGSVTNSGLITINIGSADKQSLATFTGNNLYLNIAAGPLLFDAAGNSSAQFSSNQTLPVTFMSGLNAPTKVTLSPFGGTVIANTLNSTNTHLNATATITPGQATGGRAELYVQNRLVATDTNIAATDTEVTFTTSDGTPINTELQAAVPNGGVVTVKLYNSYNIEVASSKDNPTLTVDYVIPTISGVSSAIYSVSDQKIYLVVTGAGAVGDIVDVTKLSLYDSHLSKTYQLTNASNSGSQGKVNSSDSISIQLGTLDHRELLGFGQGSVYLYVATGSLLRDAAGNSSPTFIVTQTIPVTVIK